MGLIGPNWADLDNYAMPAMFTPKPRARSLSTYKPTECFHDDHFGILKQENITHFEKEINLFASSLNNSMAATTNSKAAKMNRTRTVCNGNLVGKGCLWQLSDVI